jgi:hypothetical protein
MAQRKTLTEQQVAIPPVDRRRLSRRVMEGTLHRISAGALRNRGLVTTSGRGPTWSAKATAAGREYLREVDGPNPPVPRKANVSVTRQLIDDIVAAGGTLRVPQSEWWTYKRKAELATRHRKVPIGKRLDVVRVGDQTEFRLVDGPDAQPAELVPDAVPETVARYHSAARTFRDRSEQHEVSREQVARATRIIHAIAVEAERRGWSASVPAQSEARGKLRLERNCKNDWIFRGRQSRWADRQSWTLEERLPHLFREIEERIIEAKRVAEEQRIAAEKRAEAERREAEERERRWHVLMDQIRHRLVETHRASQLRTQAEAWEQAGRLQRYCDALAAKYGDDPRTAEWIAWARAYAARLDPLREPPSMPEPPEETPSALQEHLPGGWSVYGPEHGYRARRW